MPSMTDVQQALERCMRAEPPQDFSLSPDSSQLATVFAEMLYGRESERPLEALTAKQLAAFNRWAA
jgi:hypothetical protein